MERLRALDQGADQLGALKGRGIRGQPCEVGRRGGIDPLAGGEEQRAVEDAVAHLARQIVDRRLASLRLGGQAVEEVAHLRGVRKIAPLQPPLQQRQDGRDLPGGAVGEDDAEQALLELRRAVERPAKSIMSESAAEAVEELRRQAGAARVQIAQIGEQVLLGAVAAVGAVRGLAAEERADVDEGAQDLLLAPQVGGWRLAGPSGNEALDPAQIGVVAEHQAPRLLQALAPRVGGAVRARHQALEAHAAT